MTNKYFSGSFSLYFPLIFGAFTSGTLIYDQSLGKWVSSCLGLITVLLTYIITEWVTFRIKINDKLEVTNHIGSILDEFAEANLLMKKMRNTVKSDLEFDNQIKKDKKYLEFHLYLSKLKYDKFFSSHFIYHSDDMSISKIPTHYFIHYIWRKLVEEFSDSYSSLQLLIAKTKKVYIEENDPNKLNDRQDIEINCLKSILAPDKITGGKHAKLQAFKKLFVLDDSWIDEDKKEITDVAVNKYLKKWYDKLCKSEKAQLKIIKFSNAVGVIRGGELKDIGIFGNILGIQSVDEPDKNDFRADNIRIDFYFNATKVAEYKMDYASIFDRASDFKEYFVSQG